MSVGLLIDTTKCIACNACSEACKEQNKLPPTVEPQPTAYTWTVVQMVGDVPVRRMCLHCLEPTCASVCPVGAVHKTPLGPVVYDSDKCFGCRYCVQACPFGVPKYQWDRPLPLMGKCILCFDRVSQGEPTACASVCPTGATLFGERDLLIRDAKNRIATSPGDYVDHIYGLEEAGGTSVLFLSKVPFETIGLNTSIPRQPLPLLTWKVLSRVPDFVGIAGVFLFGIHWITERREFVSRRNSSPDDASRDAGDEDGRRQS